MRALTLNTALLIVLFNSLALGETQLPPVFDWRNINGHSYVSPVGNQGQCGSCVAFAILTTLETQVNIARNTPYAPWEFSRQYVFSCGGGRCAKGWLLSQAVRYIEEHGVPDSACMPYSSGRDGRDVPCELGCADATGRAFHIEGLTQPTRGFVDIVGIKKALLKGPVLSSIILYGDFQNFKGGEVFRTHGGTVLGSHAITLIGWDDSKRAWIARNSMGKAWGDQGDFLIAWDDRSKPGRYTYQFHVPESAYFAAFENIKMDRTLQGMVPVKIHSVAQGLERFMIYATQSSDGVYNLDPNDLVHEIGIDQRPTVANLARDQQPYDQHHIEAAIDTNELTNGTYYLYGAAFHEAGKTMTQPVVIHIKNNK